MVTTATYALTTTKSRFQTNTYEPTNQLAPDVLGLSGGGFVAAYNNSALTSGFILLDFFNSQHLSIGSQTPYETANTVAIGQPRLAELANGNVLVVWDDNDAVESDAGLKGRVYTAGGATVGAELDLSDIDFTGYAEVNVAALSNGNFVVTYLPASGPGVAARIYNQSGVLQGSPIIVDATANLHDSQVTALTGGGWVVVWTDQNAADDKIRMRTYDNAGTTPGSVITLADVGDDTTPSIATLPNGNFAVVYADTGYAGAEGASHGITLQIFTPLGINVTPGIRQHVNTPTAADEADPDVAVLSNGFIVVTWTFPYNPADHDIFARIYDQAGNPVTINNPAPDSDQFTIVANGSDELVSAVSGLAGGEFITTWQDSSPDSSVGSIASVINELVRTVVGDGASDNYTGDSLRESIDGGAGGNTLDGGGGNDTIHGGDGYDLIYGGSGNDLLQGGFFSDEIHGGLGNDRIYAGTQADPGGTTYSDLIFGDAGVDRVQGAAGDDIVHGGTEGDKLNGGAANDSLSGDEDDDKLKGQSGNDTLEGGTQADTVNGGVGDDVLYAMAAADITGSVVGDALNGANGDDTIHGSGGMDNIAGLAGKDVMHGGAEADTLSGGTGKDILDGGADVDRLTGGGDKDTFDYNDISDSAVSNEDLITDLGNQDVIDLSGIDAKTVNPGDQAFTLVAAFTSHRGELVVAYHATGLYAGLTTISGDTNGDGLADFTITATGDRHNFGNFVF